MRKFKIGDKVIVKNGVDKYSFTNAGSIGIIKKLYRVDYNEVVDIEFTKLKGPFAHSVPAVFDIFLEDIELLDEKKVIKPYGIVAFLQGGVK